MEDRTIEFAQDELNTIRKIVTLECAVYLESIGIKYDHDSDSIINKIMDLYLDGISDAAKQSIFDRTKSIIEAAKGALYEYNCDDYSRFMLSRIPKFMKELYPELNELSDLFKLNCTIPYNFTDMDEALKAASRRHKLRVQQNEKEQEVLWKKLKNPILIRPAQKIKVNFLDENVINLNCIELPKFDPSLIDELKEIDPSDDREVYLSEVDIRKRLKYAKSYQERKYYARMLNSRNGTKRKHKKRKKK